MRSPDCAAPPRGFDPDPAPDAALPKAHHRGAMKIRRLWADGPAHGSAPSGTQQRYRRHTSGLACTLAPNRRRPPAVVWTGYAGARAACWRGEAARTLRSSRALSRAASALPIKTFMPALKQFCRSGRAFWLCCRPKLRRLHGGARRDCRQRRRIASIVRRHPRTDSSPRDCR